MALYESQCISSRLLNNKVDKTDIAPVENGTTASRAYSIGQQFYLPDGKLYRAKAAIASGATFTIGTNCELADCLTEQINRTVVFNRTKAVNLKDTSVYDARYNKWFTVPDDGYVYIGCETAGFSLLLVISDSTQDVNISNHTYSELYKDKCADLIFVKKGMYLAMDSVQSNVTGFSYDFQYRPIY